MRKVFVTSRVSEESEKERVRQRELATVEMER